MIKDVTINQLKIIDLEEGRVFHALKKIDSGYKGFGEAYFSEIGPKKIKAWKRHLKMTMNLILSVLLIYVLNLMMFLKNYLY